jgi:hypothetical protein
MLTKSSGFLLRAAILLAVIETGAHIISVIPSPYVFWRPK